VTSGRPERIGDANCAYFREFLEAIGSRQFAEFASRLRDSYFCPSVVPPTKFHQTRARSLIADHCILNTLAMARRIV